MGEKHTPGPWRVEADMRSERVGDAYSADGYREYLAGWNITSDEGEIVGIEGITCEDPANAYLIAAAPDLLAVAQYAEAILADVFEGKVDSVTALDAISDLAKPAIAKATPTPATSA